MPRRILKLYDDPAVGDRLHALAVTEHALLAYAVRVLDGMDKRKAFAMLMAGRHLSEADIDFVLAVVDHFDI